jgi:hypothetical protein
MKQRQNAIGNYMNQNFALPGADIGSQLSGTDVFRASSRQTNQTNENSSRQQLHTFHSLAASQYIQFNPKTMALLYCLKVRMLERSVSTR